MSLEWFIGKRYLASRRGTRFLSASTGISIGGVAVGVTALIVVISVMTGLQTDLRDKILGTNPHIWVMTYGEGMRMDDWRSAQDRVRRIPGVVSVAPFVHTEVGLSNRAGYAEGAVLRGVGANPTGEPITTIHEALQSDSLSLGPTKSGLPPIVVGWKLADRFNLLPGDTVTVTSFQGARVTAFGGIMPKLRKFEMVGRFRTGMYQYDEKFMYTSLGAAQELIGLGEAVSGLEVRTPDPLEADLVGDRIDKTLGLPFRSDDWKTQNGPLFAALKLEKLAMGVILLLIVVVAAFNIVSTLIMLVTEKTREIGILKSMGLSSRKVLRIFMIQGLVIGTVGSLLGAAGGGLLTWAIDRFELIRIPGEIYFVDHLPVGFDPVDVAVILLSTIVISFLATIYPALQAARLTPIEAIRHE